MAKPDKITWVAKNKIKIKHLSDPVEKELDALQSGNEFFDKHVIELEGAPEGEGEDKGVWFKSNPNCVWFGRNLY